MDDYDAVESTESVLDSGESEGMLSREFRVDRRDDADAMSNCCLVC